MATLQKTYNFTSDAQGWVAGGDTPNTVLEWSGSGGNPTGCFKNEITGRNKSADADWSLTTTWEALGVPVGASVTSIKLDGVDWRCSVWLEGHATTPSEFRSFLLNQSDAITLITSMSNNQGGILGTTSYATVSGVDMAIPSEFQPSSTTVNLMADLYLRTANTGTTNVTILVDNVIFTITYSAAVLQQFMLVETII